MSTSAIVFSRDRAAQLDLFLRSVTCNAPDLFSDVRVIWTASSPDYERAYRICREEHNWVDWDKEARFQDQVLDALDETADYASFFTDDSVFYRPLGEKTLPSTILERMPGVLCFSLRLGLHTGQCYPLRRLQGLPQFEQFGDVLIWNWRTGDADFGYMGSLDGHVFRRFDLLDFLDGRRSFGNPNQLEEVLVSETQGWNRTLAACYQQSHLVGIPVNRVNDTHGNRFGELHFHNQQDLNGLYLEGKRILLSSVRAERVTAAHAEMELKIA